MMKFLFLCLLLANGALFAYQQGYLGTLMPGGREAARATRQFNAEKIKVLPSGAASASDAASAAAPETMADSAPADSTPAVPAPAAAATTPLAQRQPEKKPETIACTEIGNFSEADAARFEKQLAPLVLGSRLSRRAIEEVFSRIVYLPPQGSKEDADRKTEELRQRGVSDFFIIKDDSSMRWAISLGVYKTQAAANARLADLTEKGVQTAFIGNHSVSANKVAFQLRNLEAGTKDALVKIKAHFRRQQLRTCG